GNLMVHLPIGPRYPVGPSFGYQLMLSYNSKLWEFDKDQYGIYEGIPDRSSNAGFGWYLSLGWLLSEGAPNSAPDPLTYVDPTGNRHRFFLRFHDEADSQEYDCTPNSGHRCDVSGLSRVLYTTDGSYLRMKIYTSGIREVDFPNGDFQRFDQAGKLIYGSDAFGNSYT